MSKINGDSASEKLSMLLDGELSSSQEVSLFSELSINDELRSEMRDMLSIKNAVHSDSEAFVPPLAATAAVFTKAGFALPGAYYIGLKTLLLKYSWIPLLVAALTGFTTFSIMKNNHNMELAKLKADMGKMKNTVLASQSKINRLTAENSKLRFAVTKKSEIREIVRYIKVPAVSAQELSSANNANSTVSNSSIIQNNNNDDMAMLSISHSFNSNNSTAAVPNDNLHLQRGNRFSIITNNSGYSLMPNRVNTGANEYSLRFGGLSGLTFPLVNIDSPDEFANITMGLYFLAPYKDVYIGIESGREPFSQQFNNLDPDGHKYLYEQRPNIWWGGASIITEFGKNINILSGARPYSKIFLGASELGPLGKISAGFNWKSSWGLGAFLGLEGTLLAYQNQGVWYTSQKIGLVYGMSIQF